MHKASGGFGALNVYKRAPIPRPYATPDGDFTLLVGDWYNAGHKVEPSLQLLLLFLPRVCEQYLR